MENKKKNWVKQIGAGIHKYKVTVLLPMAHEIEKNKIKKSGNEVEESQIWLLSK